jgi:hypothetical protein
MTSNPLPRIEAGERWSGDNAEVLARFGLTYRWAGGECLGTWHGDKQISRRALVPLDSVDDALALVPEGWGMTLKFIPAFMNPKRRWQAVLWDGHLLALKCGAHAPTHAAALVAAILRAKEAGDAE